MTEKQFPRIDSNNGEDDRWSRIQVGEFVAEVEAYKAKPSITAHE